VSEITDKVLRSGLIDRHTAELMERYGMLPEGSADKTKAEVTREQMGKLAEDLSAAVEREHMLRETSLDLDRLRWPAVVSILSGGQVVVRNLHSIIDRHGRYYFRTQDVNKDWFIPGRILERQGGDDKELIVEVSPLYVGEDVVCYQVSTVDG
jgi:endonuclease III-like uncharacterized protein